MWTHHTGVEATALVACPSVHPLQADDWCTVHYQDKHLITLLMTASSWLTLVNRHYDHRLIVSMLYHTATARSANDRFVWLAHVCGMTCPNISATSDFQSTLLANVSKCYCSLLHQAAVHFWQFWFLCAIYKCTYLLSGRIFIDEYRKHQHRWLDSAQCGREYLVVDFNFRWAELPIVFSLSGFANLSTKVTNQRVFRLSLFFLLTENSQWFQSAKVKVNYCLKSVEV